MTTTSSLLRIDGTPYTIADIDAIRQTRDDQRPQTQRVAYKMRTQAGVLMTADQAMTISAVWACMRFLSQSVAKLPWRVKKQSGTNSEIQPNHQLDWKLNKRPAPEWSSFQFRETLMHWALRYGNGYAEIERDVSDRPVWLHPLPPYRTNVMRDAETRELFYRVTGSNSGGTVDLEAKDVFHLRGLGEGPVGLNVMAYAAASLGWAKAAQIFGSSFFGHGAQLSGVVTMKKPLTPEALKVLREDFQNLYGTGPSKANGVAFLDNEMDYKSIGIDPEKGQFIETNTYLLGEVCRWFGVPPHKIYDLSKATFSNIEHQSIEVVEDSLRPWIQRLQDEADYKLFGANRQNLFTEIDVASVLRPDTANRMLYYQGLRNIGALNADEIRDREGINAIGDKDGGKKFTMQAGMTTLERIGEEPVAGAPGSTSAPPAPADPAKPGPEPSPTKSTPGPKEPATTAHFWQTMIDCGLVEEAMLLDPQDSEEAEVANAQ